MKIRGSCECGEVTFSVTGPLSPTFACHCSQCRKTSGHYWAATVAKHIFMADKGTYYDVADGLPQSESW